KDLGITQKSAYKLLDDLRNSLKQSNFIKEMLKDFVEIDETYVGDKTPTLVMIKRGGNTIAEVVPDVKQRTLEPIIRKKKQYVNGKASTNTAENFNSHFKGTIKGTYH
ncbi:11486_t:CDS:2, partial [Racocetra persica]